MIAGVTLLTPVCIQGKLTIEEIQKIQKLTKSDFEQHPIVFGYGTREQNVIIRRVSSPTGSIIGRLSVSPLFKVSCSDLEHGMPSMANYPYSCLGLLENEKNAVVTVAITMDEGTIIFSKNLTELGTESYLTTTFNGKEYELRLRVKRSTIRVQVGTPSIFGVGIGVAVPCYYINFPVD